MAVDADNDLQATLKEYELLRTELLQHDHSVLQVLGIVFGFVGLITASGIGYRDPYIFLVPMVLLIAVSLYIADKRLAVRTIASYIRRCIERYQSHLCWEGILYHYTHPCKEHDRSEAADEGDARRPGAFGRFRYGIRSCCRPGISIIWADFLLLNLTGLLELILFLHFAHENTRTPAGEGGLPSRDAGICPEPWGFVLAVVLYLALLAVTCLQKRWLTGDRSQIEQHRWETARRQALEEKKGRSAAE